MPFDEFLKILKTLVKDEILQTNAGSNGETYKLSWKAKEVKFMERYLSEDLAESSLPNLRTDRIKPTVQNITKYAKHNRIIKFVEILSWIVGIIAGLIAIVVFAIQQLSR